MATGRVPTTANSPLTTKGDIFGYSTTSARVAVGNDGDTLLADSSQSTGLRWGANLGFTAGKNKIINGDFNINQRGFTTTTTASTYGFDRWFMTYAGNGTTTYSAQTFTPGTAPVSGYEGANFARMVTTGQTGTNPLSVLSQPIENPRTFANQTITLSFWAKAGSGTPGLAATFYRNYGSGGSPSAAEYAVNGQKVTLSTSWARYSLTYSIPTISGKTLGTTANTGYLSLEFWTSGGTDWNTQTASLGIQSATIDIWGVQVESGSVATSFQTATGTLQGELAACQRYYYRMVAADAYQHFGNAWNSATTVAQAIITLPISMRVVPSSLDTGGTIAFYQHTNATDYNMSSIALVGSQQGNNMARISATISGGTLYATGWLRANNSTTAYLGFSAEL